MLLADSRLAIHESVLSEACLSFVRRWVHCGETAIDRLVISLQADVASTWLRQAPNSIKIGLAVFEQWRTLWTYPLFSTANIGNSFKKLQDRPMITMKHYWEVDIGLSKSAYKIDLG